MDDAVIAMLSSQQSTPASLPICHTIATVAGAARLCDRLDCGICARAGLRGKGRPIRQIARKLPPHPATHASSSATAMESDRERNVPLPCPAPNPNHHQPLLRAAKSTAFKREERRKRKERKRQDRLALELARWEPLGGAPPRPAATSPSRVPPVDTPWPCDPPPYTDPAPSAAWSWGPPAEPPLEPPQAPAAATCPQAAAVRACRAFFGEHDDDGDEEEEGEEQGNVARFFEELLEKDAGLRGLYEAERERGRFLCLVCEGIGARAGKRFAGCAALVQHAGSVARTKGRLAHRAFADAVGRLLGWGTGRTTSMPAGSDSDGACDQVDHLDDTQSAQMEMF